MLSEYRIAGISVQVDAPSELMDNDGFRLYRVSGQVPPVQRVFRIRMIPEPEFRIPEFHGSPVFSDPMHLVVQNEQHCLHLFHVPSTEGVTAWNWITSDDSVEIHYHPALAEYYLNSVGCFNAAGFERVLYSHGLYLFHCSYVDWNGKAVLFSAPSGGGKTTQATLWEQFAGAEMVNGDRAVLEASGEGYLAHGLPIAGSSGVFINRTLPIRAIFIVKKAAENCTERLSQQEAFEALFSQLTINTWNHEFVLGAVDFAMRMAQETPVFRLECRIDQGAVDAAKKAMQEVE